MTLLSARQAATVVPQAQAWWRRRAATTPQHVTLDIAVGEIIAVTGNSSSGKSTLLFGLAGIWPMRGVVERRGRCAMQFQRDGLMPDETINEQVLSAALKANADQAHERTDAALALVELTAHRDAWPHTLSFGQRRRAGIARALATAPDLLFLDDPTAGLDPKTARHVLEQLQNGAAQRATIIATSEPESVLPFCHRAIRCRIGQHHAVEDVVTSDAERQRARAFEALL